MKRETLDPDWHRARIAARIWLKAQQGRPLSTREKRLARFLAEHQGVSNRLIEQARAYRDPRYRRERDADQYGSLAALFASRS